MPDFSRLTTGRDRDLVVFLIGMRVNRPLAIRQWLPVFLAMPGMLRELRSDPDSGLLGVSSWLSGRTVLLIQYWDSYDQLDDYATNSSKKHRPAWTRFNRRRGRAATAVGVFHETYVVAPNRMETIYDAMTPILLGRPPARCWPRSRCTGPRP